MWYWAGDSSGSASQDVWIEYDTQVSKSIELAFCKNQSKVDVGGGRTVLFSRMIQIRDGDFNRARAVLRAVEKLKDTSRKLKVAGLAEGECAEVGTKKTLCFDTAANSVHQGAKPENSEDGAPKGMFQRAFLRPTMTTLTSVSFAIGDGSGVRMRPGESWIFEIPKSYHCCNLLTVVLSHRKPTEDVYLMESYSDEYDKEGAYTLIQAQRVDKGLVSWMDGSASIKFAEPRPKDDPEEENLHDWLVYCGRIQCFGIVLTGKGVGPRGIACIHKLAVEFEPPFTMHALQEKIFTTGTTFVRIDQSGRFDPKCRVIFGGGPDAPGQTLESLVSKGLYPGSVMLGIACKDMSKDFGNGIRLVKGRLHVALIPSKVFLMIEVSCGDTIFDKDIDAEKKNKDGHYGRLGWAKLFARLANQERFIMWNVNVPPNAVLRGGANELEGHLCVYGEEIVIESRYCPTFVMGLRVIYKKMS